MQRFKRTTSEFKEYVRGLSDEELLRCVSDDDSVAVPMSLMCIEDVGDVAHRKHGSLISKQTAIEKELNRRCLRWRQYSDQERDCIWSLKELLFSDAPMTPEAVKEFWRLVDATGGRVPCPKFSPSDAKIEVTKLRLEAIGLHAEWTLSDTGSVWIDVKGRKEC